MKEQNKKLFLIKIAYWLGIGADTFWAVVLLFPKLLWYSDWYTGLQSRFANQTYNGNWRNFDDRLDISSLMGSQKTNRAKSCYPINSLSCSIWIVHCGTYWISGRKYSQYLDSGQNRNTIHIHGYKL